MKPIVQPLARWHRKLIFLLLLAAFLLSMPIFIFYATGYRYDFFAQKPEITATGGLYIAAEAADSSIHLNEVEVKNARVFRKASYIQGLEPGLQHVHVQAPGLYTWVKDLPVYPHIVTEAESFNLPLVPQVRTITEYQTKDGESVFWGVSTSTKILDFASTTMPFLSTSSKATSSYSVNSEYILINNLFLEQASTTKKRQDIEKKFGFATTSASTSTGVELATTTVTRNDIALYQVGEEVFARALGVDNQIPHYYCTSELDKNLDPELAMVFEENGESALEEKVNELSRNGRICRTEIRIDRKWQAVHSFDFFPMNEDLVLMNLDEGIYVVEIDDRSWQNTQLIYPGKNLMMLVDGGNVFVKDRDIIVEILPELIIP
jgi:hypothetical protein